MKAEGTIWHLLFRLLPRWLTNRLGRYVALYDWQHGPTERYVSDSIAGATQFYWLDGEYLDVCDGDRPVWAISDCGYLVVNVVTHAHIDTFPFPAIDSEVVRADSVVNRDKMLEYVGPAKNPPSWLANGVRGHQRERVNIE